MRIIVDADACPRGALDTCLHVARELCCEAITVASFNHQIDSPHHIVVGDNSQEVDLKVANLAKRGDVVVTQDMGLAALVMAKGATAINTLGRQYRSEDMTLLLEEREAKAKFRRSGGRTKGPRKRTAEDEESFRKGLMRLITGNTGDSSFCS